MKCLHIDNNVCMVIETIQIFKEGTVLNQEKLKDLEVKAAQVRLEILRMFSHGKDHHFGGSISCVDMLTMVELKTIKRLGSVFQGHPNIRKTKGIEAPTGSLGMGLSFSNGLALAGRHKKRSSYWIHQCF